MHARVQVYGVAGSVEKTSTYLRHAAVSLFVGTLRKYIPTFSEHLPLYLSVAPLPFQKTKIKQQKKLDLEMRTARLRLREMIDQAKTQEREAILNEERKRQGSSSGTGAYSGTNGGAASPGPGPRPGSGSGSGSAAASYDAKMANGSSMGRRTQSSTGAPFAPRRASTGTGAGESTERGKRPQGKLGRSGAQPKPIDQMRQTFVEDTLTDFFGL